MPANLTPQYYEAERVYKEAKSTQEKIEALEAMLAIMPKHKGTDKLKADLRRRLSQLKKDQTKKAGGKKTGFDIRKEGAGQIVLIGMPNSGKSTILKELTKAETEVASYPYTTRKATPGMMDYENIQIQLIDIPPFTDEFAETWLNNIIRNCDALALIIDLSLDPVKDYNLSLEKLEHFKVKPLGMKEFQVEEEFIRKERKLLLVGNKIDLEDSEIGLELLKDEVKDKFPLVTISSSEEINIENFKREVFRLLHIVRVYSKAPGQEVNYKAPFILKKGSTVMDFAERVHKDFKSKLLFARIWGSSNKYTGQRVNRDYILEDEDVIELKTN